jgi:alcohol dehydrogenase (cytochrome c)
MRAILIAAVCAVLASAAAAQVSFERIVQADKEPGNWLTYSRNYQGHRFSPLAEINVTNVGNLKVKWAFQFSHPSNEVSPIVVDGVMYVTGPNAAAALDARTGRTLWFWRRPIPSDYHNIGFGRVNRGPAILDDKLYVTTLDCYLVALDLKSGTQLWATQIADYKLGYSMTVAPLAIDGKIVVGVSGGEAGIRGFVDAYDAKTGKQAWRFWTIPGPGEPGHETWSRRTGARNVVRRKLENGRWLDLGHRRLRSRPETGVLGRRQSGAGLEWRRAARRQSVHVLPSGARRRYGTLALVFPIQPA